MARENDSPTTPDPADAVVVGVDFGTLSGRAVVVRVADGTELGSAVHEYPHGVIDDTLPATGERLPPEWALQHPQDWREVYWTAVPKALAVSGVDPRKVTGIGTDFTACTMVPTTDDGTPLCELQRFAGRKHAYPKLWRHHAAQPQADRINRLAAERDEWWLPRYGGFISSEWEAAKGLQVLEEDPEIYAAMAHWAEGADWIVWQLAGRYTRNVSSAGFKGTYQDGSYPDPEFLAALNPDFAGFIADKVDRPMVELGACAGTLSRRGAEWTGLPSGIAVASGNIDAHVAAPAARGVSPGQMVAIMGTSTCHIMNHTELVDVPGMSGVVRGGVASGMVGYEAGQSGVGDIFGWLAGHHVPAGYRQRAEERGVSVHDVLTELAGQQRPGEHGLLALDWHSGNRSVLVDHDLSGVIIGETLATRAEDIYRALIEATAMGTRKIVETFLASGVPVTEFIAAGGLARNEMLMQIYADVLNMPLSVAGSDQASALGAAIHGAVAAGAYPDVYEASEAMGRLDRAVYTPVDDHVSVYDQLYEEYTRIHDYFGRGGNRVMYRLRELRRAALDQT